MNKMLAGDSLVERPDVLEYVILPLLDVKEMQVVFDRINADEENFTGALEMFGGKTVNVWYGLWVKSVQ